MMTISVKKYKKRFIRLCILAAVMYVVPVLLNALASCIWPFPDERLELFEASPRVTDCSGSDLMVLVSEQQQWCMPVEYDQICNYVIDATIAVEDSRFYDHCGVDFTAVIRAVWQNVTHMRVVSGASTLTMQICRMIDDRPRTLKSKAIESFRARQLEKIRDKRAILTTYLNYAPYGGNIRGVEAASLMYFSKRASELSIAESAFLAGLPQAPAAYNPYKHLSRAIERQQFVLLRMYECNRIDREQYETALAEKIEINPIERKMTAPHAAWLALRQKKHGGKTTINNSIQSQVEEICGRYQDELPGESEVAIVVIDIEKSAVVAMVGSGDVDDPKDGQVNGAVARRSPGSTLKPFIYAMAFEQNRLSPESMLYDVPISIAGWTPSNFDKKFYGELPASEALRKSLNIPAIWVAKCMGAGNCYELLRNLGIQFSSDIEQRSGLSFIVGGCEVSLLELTNAYAVFGRGGVYSSCCLYEDQQRVTRKIFAQGVCDNINEILSSKSRVPGGLANVELDNMPWFTWKTGTSSSRRDAWSIGHNKKYAIGVWVGKFSGSGRYEYVGAKAAEPLLSRLFNNPVLCNNVKQGKTETIRVVKALPVPVSLDSELHIVSPENGENFIAYDGKVEIVPKANQDGKLHWLLNDEYLAMGERALLLVAGQYSLKCVNDSGEVAVVSFEVK